MTNLFEELGFHILIINGSLANQQSLIIFFINKSELKDGKLEAEDYTLYVGDKLRVFIKNISTERIIC